MNQTIGVRLKIARKRSNIYQADAAIAVGMARPSLSAIETGKRAVSAEEIKQFAKLYNVSVLELLYGFESESAEMGVSSQKQRILTYVAEYTKLKPREQEQVLDLIKKLRQE